MASQIEAFLHRYRNAGERLFLAFRRRLVGHPRLGLRTFEVANHDCVDLGIEARQSSCALKTFFRSPAASCAAVIR